MPGRLRKDAWCPVCGRDINALYRLTSSERTRLSFEHPEDRGGEDNCILQGSHGDMDRVHGRLHDDVPVSVEIHG